ncbi:hypothetical protein CMUS01_00109 [Colletotrichum musicola]|uniref:Uncharacterized protein n=1 Tax=Colletotrichum musicola TaxID=2175873 RepID=A0A8H6U9A7_9PEZI|nr:hypothetical protein CMUS01_00109 [Colletotrichum musicola]
MRLRRLRSILSHGEDDATLEERPNAQWLGRLARHTPERALVTQAKKQFATSSAPRAAYDYSQEALLSLRSIVMRVEQAKCDAKFEDHHKRPSYARPTIRHGLTV